MRAKLANRCAAVAHDVLYLAGRDGVVDAATTDGKALWSLRVDAEGQVWSLIPRPGRLYGMTKDGVVFCLEGERSLG